MLKNNDVKTKKLQSKNLLKAWKEIDSVFHHQSFLYFSKIIWFELINYYHDNQLTGYFRIDKTSILIVRKYYWVTLCQDIGNYVKECSICLALKIFTHKHYNCLQFLPVLTKYYKDLSMNFVIDLPIWMDRKEDSYDTIPVIIDCMNRMIHYEPVKTRIHATSLKKVIIDMIVSQHGLSEKYSVIKTHCLPWSFHFYYITSSTSSETSLLHFIHEQMARQGGKILQ